MESSNKEKDELVEKIRKRAWSDLEDLKNTFLKLSKQSLTAKDVLWMIPDQDPMVSRFAYGLAKRFPIPGITTAVVERMKRMKASDRTPFIELLKDLNSPEQDEALDTLLGSSNVQEQALGAQIVLSQPPQRVTDQLILLLGHSEIRYRFRALQRVRQYLDVGMKPNQRLYNTIEGLLDDPDAKIRNIAERAITLSRQRGVEEAPPPKTPEPAPAKPSYVQRKPIEDERPAEHSGRTGEGADGPRHQIIPEKPAPVPSPPKVAQPEPTPASPETPLPSTQDEPKIAATGTDQVVAQPQAVPNIAPALNEEVATAAPSEAQARGLRPVATAPPTNEEPAGGQGHDALYLTLARNLAHGSATIRANTIEEALRNKNKTDVLVGVLKVLSLQADWVQDRVVQSLMEHDEELLTTVVNLLRNEDPNIRRVSTGFALNFSSYKLIIPCTENSGDHDNIIRCLSLEILGRLDNPDVIDDILDALKKPAHRNFGIRALRMLPSPESLQQFLSFLKDRNTGTRLMAIRSLVDYEDERVTRLLEDLKDQDSSLQVRREAARVAIIRQKKQRDDAPVDFTDNIGNQVVERTLDKLLQQVREADNASLVIRPESQPMMRSDGTMEALSRVSLSSADTKRMTQRILSDEEWSELERNGQIVVGYEVAGTGRYRGSIYSEGSGFGAVFDTIPNVMPLPAALGVPESLKNAMDLSQGLVLLSGGPHSGRSTTMNTLINYVNNATARFVVSLENPIEFSHVSNRSFVCQRQVGRDCADLPTGISESIAQGADMIAIGEIADGETLDKALEAAENGALVIGVMKANSFDQAVEKTVEFAEKSGGRNALQRLGRNLRVLQHQGLMKRADGAGKVSFHSILLGNEAAGVILEEKALDLLPSLMDLATPQGMQSTHGALLDLVRRGLVEPKAAIRHAPDRASFEQALNNLAEELG